jgi:hypothetical protein
LIRALAMATLCFCPPDNMTPLSPTNVSNPSGRFLVMKLYAFASLATATSWSSVTAEGFSAPYKIFSRIEHENKTGSCEGKHHYYT